MWYVTIVAQDPCYFNLRVTEQSATHIQLFLDEPLYQTSDYHHLLQMIQCLSLHTRDNRSD